MQDWLRPLLSVLKITSPKVTRQLQVAMVAVGSLFPFWPSYPLSFTLLPRLVCRARPLLEPRVKTRVAVAWPPAVSFPARMGPPSLYTRGLGPYLCLVSPMYPCPPRSFMAPLCLIFRACYRLWLPGFLGPGPESEVNV